MLPNIDGSGGGTSFGYVRFDLYEDPRFTRERLARHQSSA
jgi:hypothetical protein